MAASPSDDATSLSTSGGDLTLDRRGVATAVQPALTNSDLLADRVYFLASFPGRVQPLAATSTAHNAIKACRARRDQSQ